MITLPATTGTAVKHCVLVKMTVNTGTYTIANTYGPITVGGTTYTGLGHFLGFAEIQDDLQATNNSLGMSLSGIPKDPGEAGLGTWSSYVSLILNTPLKGSRVQIYRAFINDDWTISSDNVSLRYDGYVSNFTISDTEDLQNRTESYTCLLNLSSVHAILEKQISGRRTNPTDQKALYTGDTSFDRVPGLINAQFDFGKPVSSNGGTGGGAGSGEPPQEIGGQEFQTGM
jgi:hypothetical protein